MYIRTEKIGFCAFLAQKRVLGISPECDCGEAIQTPKYVIVACLEHSRLPNGIATETRMVDYRVLTSTKKGLCMLA